MLPVRWMRLGEEGGEFLLCPHIEKDGSMAAGIGRMSTGV
jgi:hypothetical protein